MFLLMGLVDESVKLTPLTPYRYKCSAKLVLTPAQWTDTACTVHEHVHWSNMDTVRPNKL